MSNLSVCALCLEDKPLQVSHLVPKSIINWLKETSATGYIRHATNPNVRKQDFLKEELLCVDCEQLFSRFENYFVKRIFYPHLKGHDRPQGFKYDENLRKFIVSLNWRTLQSSVNKNHVPNNLMRQVNAFLEESRLFLLGKIQKSSYEHHMFFLGVIESGDSSRMPDNFHQYLLRGIDTTIVTQEKKRWYKRRIIFQYTKIPYIVFVSFIKPRSNANWIGTRVEKEGIISSPQEIRDGRFGSFLLDRGKVAYEMYQSGLSKRQSDKITKTMFKNPYRALVSDTHKAFLADQKFKTKDQEEK